MNYRNSIMFPAHGAADAQGYSKLTLAQAPKEDSDALSDIAVAFALAGDRDRKFEYLEKAFSNQDSELLLCIRYPAFDSMRSHPRYADLMRRLGLPQ